MYNVAKSSLVWLRSLPLLLILTASPRSNPPLLCSGTVYSVAIAWRLCAARDQPGAYKHVLTLMIFMVFVYRHARHAADAPSSSWIGDV